MEDARQKLIDLAIFLSQYSLDRPTDVQERQRRYMDGAWDGVLHVSAEQLAEHSKTSRAHPRHRLQGHPRYRRPVPLSIISGFDDQHKVENVTIDGLWIQGVEITRAEEGPILHRERRGIAFGQGLWRADGIQRRVSGFLPEPDT